METSELSEKLNLSTYIPSNDRKYCDYIDMVNEGIKLLRDRLETDEIVVLSAKEIADALYFKHKSTPYHSGGRKSRIAKIHHWIFEYLLDVPNISRKSLLKACLVCLYPTYAKSTIYQAFREYFQKFPKKNEYGESLKK